MNHLKLIMATVALTGLSVTAEATQQVKIEEHHPIVTKTKGPGWANVNCITLQDEFSTTNSGIMKFPVGKTVPVKASVSYSGDRQPISQSNVVFKNVDPALTIGYDPTTLQINGHKASFTFTVTLNQHLTKPALFTIKVADGSPSDNQHLTPYSQRQTVEEMLNVDEDNFTELPEIEPTDPTPDEMKKPQVEIEIPKKEEFPTVGESLIDVNTKNQVILPDMIKEKSHQMSLSGSLTPKNENNYEINNDNFSDNEKSLGNGISGQLPKTADKATPSFMYLGFTLIIFSIFGVRKLRNSEKQS
ncbi:LPXTG cell wall anchor domain-containing protein [Enterococcus hirae]|nr:LPXTG cell wall anchor domain-containing protein [Enterococcus hirae]EMF0192816.1 LPXTG cell wall anchor domain-containing protein [Enterococcus hirae]EMF0239281.1 LPXTG cell wall anchor domain-containing protein [Enterococcus hirae]EMF0246498.1 LPXTG cell wall anchor domain-containing protein [Enterococcus hirae]